jgi:amino acid adenylation domain-containing protein
MTELYSFPQSFAQQRLWFLEQLQPGLLAYNLSFAVRLSGPLAPDCLEKALSTIVQRHESLRTTFRHGVNFPEQIVAANHSFHLALVDLSSLPPGQREQEALRLASVEGQKPFDLISGPLLRAVLYKLASDHHVLMVSMHHIVSDRWSFGIFVQELGAAYDLISAGREVALPELPIQYPDYAEWQRDLLQGEYYTRLLSYWRDRLHGSPAVLELPADHPRPAADRHLGSLLRFEVPLPVAQAATTLARDEGTTLFMVLLAAFKILLLRYSGQTDILVGSPIAGRDRPELEALIGLFVNTLVLRTDLSGDPTFREVLKRVCDTCLEAYANQAMPFDKLVEKLRPQRDLSHNPLFQVSFALQNTPFRSLSLRNLIVTPLDLEHHSAQFDLSLYIEETNTSLAGFFEYNTDLFDADTITRMASHFVTLLSAAVAETNRRISDLPLLTEAESEQLLLTWNATQRSYPETTVHRLIEDHARRAPAATALIFNGRSISYGELNHRTNQLARHLRRLGVGPDVLVGICVERSLEMVVGLLAILKAGGAYVPIDPLYPSDRQLYMIQDSCAPILLTQSNLAGRFAETGTRVVTLDAGWNEVARELADDLESNAGPDNLAYVIYTSGSTGKPKGVQITHRAVVNFLNSMRATPGLEPQDTLLSVTTLSFDIFGLELWLPLAAGAKVVIVSHQVTMDGKALAEGLRRNRATIMQATPSTWRLLLQSGWKGNPELKILCGGEAWSQELVNQLLPTCKTLWNMYGPTETTIWSAVQQVRTDGVLIGHPIANTQFYVVDSRLQPVPVGVPGELLIGGDGLARGYLNRPDLTAEKFIPNPFSMDGNSRLYRTGDLVRYRADGQIEFLGRIDHQVKLRGFRIELGEIETALKRHPSIQQAVVIVREDTPNNQRLVAYFVPSADPQPDHNDLRALLKHRLPDYMVPSDFVAMRELPLTPNGKIDRKALPAPEGKRTKDHKYLAPRDTFEQNLCEAWAAVLSLDKVGIRDNFFDLGGHSLLAVQLWLRIQQILPGKDLPLSTLLEAPTVELLAAHLRNGNSHQHQLLVRMTPGKSSRAPFFCVHGRGGNVLNLRSLAMALPPDLPFYGCQAKGLDGSQPFETIEETARCYVDEIRQVQPHGPYYLGGTCYGGLVAFEMARVLEELGEPVAALVLLDCRNPIFPNSLSKRERLSCNVRFYARRAAGHARTLRSKPINEWFEYFKGRCVGFYKFLRMSEQAAAIATAEREMSDVGDTTTLGENLKRVIWANFLAAKEFVPKPYGGGALVVRASERYLDAYDDYLLGWQTVVRGAIECFEIEGDHMSILEQPAVQVLADKLDASFAEFSAQWEARQEQKEQHAGELVTAGGQHTSSQLSFEALT